MNVTIENMEHLVDVQKFEGTSCSIPFFFCLPIVNITFVFRCFAHFTGCIVVIPTKSISSSLLLELFVYPIENNVPCVVLCQCRFDISLLYNSFLFLLRLTATSLSFVHTSNVSYALKLIGKHKQLSDETPIISISFQIHVKSNSVCFVSFVFLYLFFISLLDFDSHNGFYTR